MDTHQCLRRGCDVQLPNSVFCCWRDWYALSHPTRAEIVRTRGMGLLHPERRAAFRAAQNEWGEAISGNAVGPGNLTSTTERRDQRNGK